MTSDVSKTLEKDQMLSEQTAIWLDLRRRFVPGPEDIIRAEKNESFSLIKNIVSNINIYEPIPVSSHRKFFGHLIVVAKRSVMILMKPFIKIGLGRQLSLNEDLLTVANMVTEMQLQMSDVKKRLEKLEQVSKK